MTAMDLHHEPDGTKELLFSTHYGDNRSLIQRVMIYDKCSYVRAESDKNAGATKLDFREFISNGEGNTTPTTISWGCSTDDNDQFSVQTLTARGTTIKAWFLDTWNLVGLRWSPVSADSGIDENAPEPLVNCLPDP